MDNAKKKKSVRLGRGFSLVDWIRLAKSAKDIAGRKGEPQRGYSMEEVKRHNTQHDAWMVLNGKIYNVAKYLPYHPGGPEELMRGVGVDGTELFNSVHKWVNAESMLEKCIVGWVEDEAEK